jgi:hypothetical protein
MSWISFATGRPNGYVVTSNESIRMEWFSTVAVLEYQKEVQVEKY